MAAFTNIWIDQGSDYSTTVDVAGSGGTTFDLTGYSAFASIRKSYSSSSAVSFACSIPVPQTGAITIALTNVQTAAMDPGWYVYDVSIVSPTGQVTRVLEGQVEVNAMVTFPPGYSIPVPVIPAQTAAAVDVGSGGGVQVGSSLVGNPPAGVIRYCSDLQKAYDSAVKQSTSGVS